MNDFDGKQTTFWGALAASFWFGTAFLKYLASVRKNKQGENQMEKGVSNIEGVLNGLNAAAIEIVGLAKDGIQSKDAVQLVEDILSNPDLKAKLVAMVGDMKPAIDEAKALDIAEGIELIKFEYDGVSQVLAALKK